MPEPPRSQGRALLAGLLRDIACGVFGEFDVYDSVIEADVHDAMHEFELPHVVVCFSPDTGYLTVEGPFDNGLAASRMAEDDADAGRLSGSDFIYLVLPLVPPRADAG
jgi:hypothetical protein